MSLELMFITNDERVAATAERCGVDWIFIDLEIIGKKERQGHLDTVISHHHIEDIKKIKKVIHQSKILVRINPVNQGTEEEIDMVIQEGADMIMLPYFKEPQEVAFFLENVNHRVKTCLLCETAEAVKNIDEILKLPGIDSIYIGLNDLHLSYDMDFIFEPLADGTVEKLCDKFKKKGIPYGFGGIAGLGHGDLPSEYIIAEHYRLGSTMVILSRSFYNTARDADLTKADEVFYMGIREIREFENSLTGKKEEFFQKNHSVIKKRVRGIVSNMKQSREKQ